VSEYQYDEFAAVDPPLGARQLARTARAVKPRWDYVDVVREQLRVGNFRGDPRIMMEKYFDGFDGNTPWVRWPRWPSAWQQTSITCRHATKRSDTLSTVSGN
jgi:hypothetical protein